MRMPGRPKALNQVVSLPVGSILPSPHQPRRDFNLEELDTLARSISQNGLLSPITVRKDPAGGNRYFLIAGERRLLACRRLGYEEVPAIITTVPEANAAVLTLIENLHRQDLNCFEEAEGIYALMKESGLSQQKVCAMLAKPSPPLPTSCGFRGWIPRCGSSLQTTASGSGSPGLFSPWRGPTASFGPPGTSSKTR